MTYFICIGFLVSLKFKRGVNLQELRCGRLMYSEVTRMGLSEGNVNTNRVGGDWRKIQNLNIVVCI